MFLDHLQEVAVIYYPLEDRSEGNSIVPTESCREANDGSLVWELVYDQAIGMFYVIMEFGQYTAIPMEIKHERVYRNDYVHLRWRCSMVSFIDNDSLEHLAVELHKPLLIVECLIGRDGPAKQVNLYF